MKFIQRTDGYIPELSGPVYGFGRIERREIVVAIPAYAFLDLFTKPSSQFLQQFRLDLPEDVEVVSVFAEWESRCFLLLLSHPSFDEVADGDMTPRRNGCGLFEMYENRDYQRVSDEPIRHQAPSDGTLERPPGPGDGR
jgi:hypothetical protein